MLTRNLVTSFTIPSDVHRRAGARAKSDGLSLSSAVRLLLASYATGRIAILAAPADGVTVGSVEDVPMSPATQKLAKQAFAAAKKHAQR